MNASWVAIDLMEFAVRTEDAVQSPEAALEWLRSFRDTLLMEGRNSRPMPWAVELLGMADVKIAKKSIARMQGQIVKIYGKDCDVDLECSKKYGEKYEKLKKILAAATTREGVDASTTGCNNSQVAPTRKAGDESSNTGNGADLKSATACNQFTADGDIREDSQNVTDGSNSGKLESGTSAEPLGGRGHSPESDSSALKPLPPSKSKKPKVEKHPHGEFQNVMLTDDEYIKACASIQDCDSMIERMSSYKASSGKKYKSDYAALLNWARRDEERPAQSQAPMYKTAADRDREEIQKIADYYAAQERGEKPPMPKIQLVEGL